MAAMTTSLHTCTSLTYISVLRPLLPPFLFFYFAASLFSVAFNFHPDFYLFLFHFPVCLCSRRRLSVCDQINVRVMLTGKINAWDSLPPAGVRSKVTGHSGVGRGGLYLRHLCVILCVILPFVVFISCNEILFSPILSIFRQKKRAVYQGTAVLAVPDQTEQLRRSIFCCWNPSLSRVSPCVQRCTCVGFSVGCRVFFFIPSLYGYSQVAQLAAVFIG